VFARLARLNATSKLRAALPPMTNVVVSNVRGPSGRLSLGGYPIANVFSVGPLDIDMALNLTVWSYADQLNFSVLTCPRQFPDPHVVTDALQSAFGALQDALLPSSGEALQRIS
jgi:diacylglycerol O-acyltransferase / wax synthase